MAGGEPPSALTRRWFGGVRRAEAEEAIAEQERRRAALERELEELREVVQAQERELAELREQESLIASVLLRAQASAEEIQAAADHQAQTRLKEAEQAIEELRERTRSSSDQILAHVQAVLGVLGPAGPAASEDGPPPIPDPVDDALLWPGEAAPASPSSGLPEPEHEVGEPEPVGPAAVEAVEVVEVLEPDYGSLLAAPPSSAVSPGAVANFELFVQALPTTAHAVALERRLTRITGIRRVEIDRLDDEQAVFVVTHEGAAPDLAPLTDTGVQILAAGAGRVEVRLPSDPHWADQDSR